MAGPAEEVPHGGPDTDAPGSGIPTAARWWPDLVTAATGWTLLGGHHRPWSELEASGPSEPFRRLYPATPGGIRRFFLGEPSTYTVCDVGGVTMVVALHGDGVVTVAFDLAGQRMRRAG